MSYSVVKSAVFRGKPIPTYSHPINPSAQIHVGQEELDIFDVICYPYSEWYREGVSRMRILKLTASYLDISIMSANRLYEGFEDTIDGYKGFVLRLPDGALILNKNSNESEFKESKLVIVIAKNLPTYGQAYVI